MAHPLERQRIDKWLWAARFYKTRSLAAEEIGRGRVLVNGATVKPARELKPGDEVRLRQGAVARTVVVQGLSAVRGPAPVAQRLYEETADSMAARLQAAQARRLAPEPALSIAQGRPTKRDRRLLDRQRRAPAMDEAPRAPHKADWGRRWSAALENDA